MKERPILFSGSMVRAILAGRKTQTRRIGKIQSAAHVELEVEYGHHATKGLEAIATYRAFPGRGTARWGICACPYGVPCDRLWVRETFCNAALDSYPPVYFFRADDDTKPNGVNWKPAIFMPRKLSRITLEITGVRVERLNEISEDDCYAEGIYRPPTGAAFPDSHGAVATAEYMALWESINGAGSWSKNPWVWVVSFNQAK